MKVLFIAENLTYGGASRRFIDLANEMALRNIDTTLFIYNGSIQVKNIIDETVKCIEVHEVAKSKRWINRNIIYRKKCINIINEFLKDKNYDIIISFDDMVNVNILLSKYARKTNIVISERSDPYYNKFYLKVIKKFLFNRASGVVFQTKGAQNFFWKKVKKNSIIIPNPIPSKMNYKSFVGEREKIIVSVARLWIYQKRQDILLKAFNKVKENHPEYKLVLYGDGDDEVKIQDMINEMNLNNNVILAGVTDNVFKSIERAGLFVLSSDFEGIPNALIEAMSIGLPVVSTDCSPGGARLLIKNKENGLLVPRGDVNKLAMAIESLINNPEKAKEMGQNSKKIVKEFDKEKIYTTWETYLNFINDNTVKNKDKIYKKKR